MDPVEHKSPLRSVNPDAPFVTPRFFNAHYNIGHPQATQLLYDCFEGVDTTGGIFISDDPSSYAEANLDLYLKAPPNTPPLRQHQSRHKIRCGRGSEQPLVISAGEAATAHVAFLLNVKFIKVTLVISFEIPSKMLSLGEAKACH